MHAGNPSRPLITNLGYEKSRA
ncbi:hypothetical protein CGRA01v4_04239 [Colletotrichum graminicola]|nr:hypothetical protein CGRA01v4_04239 [Colletotrichum graminicola]